MAKLRDIQQRLHGGRRKIEVCLARDSADEELLERLAQLGLHVHKVLGNKLFGEIEAGSQKAIQNDPDVAEVTASVPLRKHTTRSDPSEESG